MRVNDEITETRFMYSIIVIYLKCIIISLVPLVIADIYLHNPRGSNNRNNERSRERTQETLSFNSQNNARGGYNVGENGSMYYYAGSILPVQWTNQHSCNDTNSDCTLILQYMCRDNLRDGSSSQIIPVTTDGENDASYRLHETLESYLNCKTRSRNKNLFTAEQSVQGSCTSTRQNPGSTRYGLECPEERDYYPYWQPSDWVDIAVLTNRQDLCSYYRQKSQNVQSRFACTLTKEQLLQIANKSVILPNTKEECESFNDASLNGITPQWVEYKSNSIYPPPDCFTPSYTRENHLGDTFGSDMPVYNWTLPNINAKKCVLRIRYNISTGDYDGWNVDKTHNQNIGIFDEFFANQKTVQQQRGYTFKSNPTIKLFNNVSFNLKLAINTAQYGRVFQDRSYVFEIRQRPAELQNKEIFNLNVRGKRGNIVQVYPAVEYDFVPNHLEIPINSYVHIQWIGSNTNPPGNDGQGTAGTDRNNVLLLENKTVNSDWNPFQYLQVNGLLSANYPNMLVNSTLFHFSKNDLRLLAASGQSTDAQLNNASAYFDLGPRQVPSSGIYHYFSTRNNAFSNRDQKARMIVQPFDFIYRLIDQNADEIRLNNAILSFPANSLSTSTVIKLSHLTREQISEILTKNGQNIVAKESLYDSGYIIEPYDLNFVQYIKFQIPVEQIDHSENVNILQFEPTGGIYTSLANSQTKNYLNFQTNRGGVYVFVKPKSNLAWIAAVVIPIVLVIIIILSTIAFFYKNPRQYRKLKTRCTKTQRSFKMRI
ncbi:unnamed protein product [Didymodactylos carnosus]|uniref:Uncharacterized protein n=2 Tax=Didymodactylos carnosus TaxID=1234261 RepID=A0A814GIV5_9BILA|nr:unnamed protein product [Didymodactylos carnosus]CAF3768597.1 unnamed protein product [Didymodactylos carnosus]